MANFDEILAGIHSSVSDPISIEDPSTPAEFITINNKREFVLSEDFNTIIAYEGDINSQIISFKLPETYEGHELAKCQYKKVRWVNKESGIEGTSNLIKSGAYWQWQVPPEAFAKGGTLEFAISIYDTKEVWNPQSPNLYQYAGEDGTAYYSAQVGGSDFGFGPQLISPGKYRMFYEIISPAPGVDYRPTMGVWVNTSGSHAEGSAVAITDDGYFEITREGYYFCPWGQVVSDEYSDKQVEVVAQIMYYSVPDDSAQYIFTEYQPYSVKQTVFSWNTPSCSLLNVGKTLNEVSKDELPAPNEILFVDRESRNIIAPIGYNNTIGNYGDKGLGKIYFQIDEQIGKTDKTINVADSNIKIYYTIDEEVFECENTEIVDQSNGIVLFSWNISDTIFMTEITNLPISIAISEGGKVWFSNTYTQLKIGGDISVLEAETPPDEPDEPTEPDEPDEPETIITGIDTRVGSKAFTVTRIEAAHKAYVLDSVEGLEVGDEYSVHLAYEKGGVPYSDQAANYGKIVAIEPRKMSFVCEILGSPGEYSAYVKSKDNQTCYVYTSADIIGCAIVPYSYVMNQDGTITIYLDTNESSIPYPYTQDSDGNIIVNTEGTTQWDNIWNLVGLPPEGVVVPGESYQPITNAVQVDEFFDIPSGAKFVTEDDYTTAEGIDWETNTFRIMAKPDVGTREIGDMAVALGYKTQALSKGATAFGLQTIAHGNWSVAEGYDTKATGYVSHAKGFGAIASGSQSSAEGHDTEAIGENAHAEGDDTEASGKSSHTEGYKTKATKEAAHAEGIETEATASGAHAQGNKAKATGAQSSAEGFDTTASGEGAHAGGNKTTASGPYSVSYGFNTKATNEYSVAFGLETEAHGKRSAVFGEKTGTYKDNSFVVGRWNHIPQNTGTAWAFIVGNGDPKSQQRSNALSVGFNGDTHVSKDVYVNCNGAMGGGLKLGTIAKENSGGSLTSLSIRVVDALPGKPDSNIIYFVKGSTT